MIKSITFKTAFSWDKDKIVIPEGLTIELQPGINILAGDQGAGKSTLIELLRSFIEKHHPRKGYGRMRSYSPSSLNGQPKLDDLLEIETDTPLEETKLVALDFEQDASRSKGSLDWDGPLGGLFQVFAMRMSHGQSVQGALNQVLNDILKERDEKGSLPPMVMIFDEPDAALSIKSIATLHGVLRNIVEKLGAQIILSAHHPFLLGCFKQVFSMEKHQWISPKDYFLSQLANPLGGRLLEHYQGI